MEGLQALNSSLGGERFLMSNITKHSRKVKFKDLPPEEQKAEQIRKYESIWRFKKALCDEIQKRAGKDSHRWEVGERIKTCSCYGEIKEYLLDNFRIRKTRKCHQSVCPACQASKSNTRVRNLTGVLDLLNNEREQKGLDKVKVFEFEISPKNCEDLEAGVRSCFEIVEKSFGSHGHGKFFTRSAEILGGHVSFEITRNRTDNTWHPHFHGSIWVDPLKVPQGFTSWFEYNEFWVNDELCFYNYWAYKLYLYIRDNLKKQSFVRCAPARNLYETVKYSMKPNCIDSDKSTGLKPCEALDAWDVLRKLKKQTFRTYGLLRKLDVEDENLLSHGREYILWSFCHWDTTGKYQEETDGVVHLEQDESQRDEKVLDKLTSGSPPAEIEDKYFFDSVSGEL